jgi:hypothetical protein
MRRLKELTALCLGLSLLLTALLPAAPDQAEQGPELVVRFVQTNEQGLETLEHWLGFSLDPQAGRCMLTSAELNEIAGLLDGAGFETLGRISVPVTEDKQEFHASDRSVTFPTQFARKAQPGDAGETVAFGGSEDETVPLGLSGTVKYGEPLPSGHRLVVLSAQVAELSGWKTMGHRDLKVPFLKNWCLMTTLYLAPGEAAVMVNRPYMAFEESEVFPKGKPTRDKVFLVLVSLQGGK